jgi:hypothetical protein
VGQTIALCGLPTLAVLGLAVQLYLLVLIAATRVNRYARISLVPLLEDLDHFFPLSAVATLTARI